VIRYEKTEELLNEEKAMERSADKVCIFTNRAGKPDRDKCEHRMRKLQIRTVKAQREKRCNRVKALQYLLATSPEARLMAVKRVTSGKGKRTAGADKVKRTAPASKQKAVQSLKRKGYKPEPPKRVYIAGSNGKQRPLGIPTMQDRAMQALYLMALEPVTETGADGNSYGFRRKRSTADAIDALHGLPSRKCSPERILEGDINSTLVK
jgi:RNA-directed DNA polymerase